MRASHNCARVPGIRATLGRLDVAWQVGAVDVRMRDLSLHGISVCSGLARPIPRRVRLVGWTFDVVADLVSCRRISNVLTLRVLVEPYCAQPGRALRVLPLETM